MVPLKMLWNILEILRLTVCLAFSLWPTLIIVAGLVSAHSYLGSRRV